MRWFGWRLSPFSSGWPCIIPRNCARRFTASLRSRIKPRTASVSGGRGSEVGGGTPEHSTLNVQRATFKFGEIRTRGNGPRLASAATTGGYATVRADKFLHHAGRRVRQPCDISTGEG